MLYSKANLKVAAVASSNPFDGALNGVLFDADGSTVASNGPGLVAVGPVKSEVHFPDVGARGTPGSQGVVLGPDFISEVETIIPKDKRLSLQHVAMTIGADPTKTEFTTIDKSGRVRRVAEHAKRDRYPNWRAAVAKALTPAAGGVGGVGGVMRVCVGRKDLLNVLRTLADACPDTGEAPVYLEIGSGIVMRAVNRETGQHVVGVAGAYNAGGSWLERDEWEQSVAGGVTEKPARKFN